MSLQFRIPLARFLAMPLAGIVAARRGNGDNYPGGKGESLTGSIPRQQWALTGDSWDGTMGGWFQGYCNRENKDRTDN